MANEQHDFYCINCGKKGIPIGRNKGHLREKFHRKRLYCIYCKQEVNHIEIKSQEDKEEFLINFENGVYKSEAEESLNWKG